jgi:hypothetical protein
LLQVLIWKLQKVYDENPDCGQGFLDLVKIKYREARFSWQMARFSFCVFYNKFRQLQIKTGNKRRKLRLVIRERQGASRCIIFLVFFVLFCGKLRQRRISTTSSQLCRVYKALATSLRRAEM